MARTPRSDQFWRSNEIAIVHCVQRCVRRAYLAGIDEVSGNDLLFRREWIRRRLEALASVFAIDILTYAILSNHLHVNYAVVPMFWRNSLTRRSPSDGCEFFRTQNRRSFGRTLGNRCQTCARRSEQLAMIRTRLSDISWFMRAWRNPLLDIQRARQMHRSSILEGRFKAQRIVDDEGLLACAMYVDLNPIRAAMRGES